MLVSVIEVRRLHDIHKLFEVRYCQACLPTQVMAVQYTAKDELDAYKKFKSHMYRRFGLTVFCAATHSAGA